MILETIGYQVIGAAYNGEDALIKYESFSIKPNIVLMDHRMPIKNGIEVTQEILQINAKNHLYSQKIIFTSADKSVKNLALSIGATSFLEKPFSFTNLVNEIEKVLKIPKCSINM